MSWERKLLHCGPRADLGDLLAHYLFISVLHHWLPRGSDNAWSLTAQAACGGQSPGHSSQMGSCMLLETQLSAHRSLCCQEAPLSQRTFLCFLWYSKEMVIVTIPVHLFAMIIPTAWNDYFRHDLYWVHGISVQTVTYNLWACFEIPLKCDAMPFGLSFILSAIPSQKMQNDLNRGVELWK